MNALVLLLAAAVAPPDLAATGIVVGTTPQTSVAILRTGGQSRIVKVGETAFGGRVTAIAWSGIALDFDGEAVEVRVRARSKEQATRARASQPAAVGADGGAAKTMTRDEVMRRVSEESPRILAETAVTPVTENGRVQGLALSRLPAGSSLLSDAGLQAGDVLTEINGTAIDGLPTLIGLWTRLQGEREIRAVVQRNGRPVALTVKLR
jgi:general secretion pathway protein C